MDDQLLRDIKDIAKVIREASLKENNINFGVIDRIANANSLDLFMFYLREAIRLYKSKKENEEIKYLDKKIERIYSYLRGKSLKEFREIVSLLTSLALS